MQFAGFHHYNKKYFLLIILACFTLFACRAAVGEPAAPDKSCSMSPAVQDLLKQAESLRRSGQIRLAESVDNAAWNLTVQERSTAIDERDDLPQALWTRVAMPYLASQETWLWRGNGSKPARVDIAIDARYAAALAQRLVKAVLSGDYRNGLMLPGVSSQSGRSAGSQPGAADIAAALKLLDKIRDDCGVTQTGFGSQAPDEARQPAGAIVYASACEPLTGTQFDAAVPDDPAEIRSCYLQGNQLETYARALLDSNLFTPDHAKDSRARAIKVLQYMQGRFADYSRGRHVDALLAALKQEK